MSEAAQPVANVPIGADFPCPACGYNLRGLTEHRCPECGERFDLATLSETALPWAHRRRLGRVRAYLGTVRMAMFQPRRLAQQMAHPIHFDDSQRFRWITVLLAWLPLLFTTLHNWDGTDRMHWVMPDGGGWGIGFTAIHLVAGLACLAAITGLPSYFFHPRGLSIEQQNRAVALSYYTCASLALSPLVWCLVCIIHEAQARYVAACVFALLQLLYWWRGLVVLHSRGLKPGTTLRAIAVPASIAILWAVVGLGTLLAVSSTLRFVAMVAFSVQD